MALSAPTLRQFHGQQDEISPVLADSTTFYKGAILVNASGKAAVASAVDENQAILGILSSQYSDGDSVDEKDTGSSNTIRGLLRRGKVWLPHTGAAQSDVGGYFTPADDDEMDDVPTTAARRYIGYQALDYDADKGLLFDLRAPLVIDNET